MTVFVDIDSCISMISACNLKHVNAMLLQLNCYTSQTAGPPVAVVKAACLESRRSRVQIHLEVSNTNVSSPLTRNDSILCGTFVTEM